ncbi:SigE family RNA polymerase sigma factor [Dactylosporangium sp. NPDC000521]|uniref:SigE family RNA polymerase sigma factor n=1 Tax=Dactylosporangium sp. NPDC000521 TaxID=3363975 RepID=UPI0036AE4A2C
MPDEAGFREEDFRDFVETRSSALLRTAYLLAGDWATAEDLLQIALTKTYLAWKRLGHIEAVEPYARRVLVNTSTSWWRRRWHGERPTEILPESAAADRVEESLERDALWRHVRELPNRQRAVLVLRFYEDQSEAETARLLGVSVGTVKSQASRALATLRQRLSAEGIEPAARPARPPTVRLRPAAPVTKPAANTAANTAMSALTTNVARTAQAEQVVPKEQPAPEDECETPGREAVLVETSGPVEVGLVT